MLRRYPILLILAVVFGCAKYHPKPLTSEAVEQKLATPEMSILQVEARSLNHPILKPIEIDDRDGLSPDEAAVLAVLANPDLRAERDRRGLANAQLLDAKLLPNPVLSYSLDVPTGGASQGAVNAFGYGVGWDVSELIGRSSRVKAARKQSESIDLSVAWQEWQVSQEAKITVYRLITLEKEVALAAEVNQRLTEIRDLTQRAMDKGTVTQLDLAAAEAAANQAHANLSELKKQFSEEQMNLNRILGFPANTRFKLQEGINLPDRWDPPATEKVTNGLEQHRLDLLALHRGYESQDAAVRAAVLRQFPAINVGLNYARDTGNVQTAGIGVSISLPIFNRNQGQIKMEEATRQVLFDEYVTRVFEARSGIAKLIENVGFLNEQIEDAETAEPSLQRLVDSYRAAVGSRSADILSYYTAWNNWTEKRIEILNLKEQLMETRIGLEIEAGLYNIDVDEGAAN